MLCIPVATIFSFSGTRHDYAYFYPNKKWEIAGAWWKSMLNAREDCVGKMDDCKVIPTTTKKTSEQLKEYVKRKGFAYRTRLALRRCETYWYVVNDDGSCASCTCLYDNARRGLPLNPPNIPQGILNVHQRIATPNGIACVKDVEIRYHQKDGSSSWWYKYRDTDERVKKDFFLCGAEFNLYKYTKNAEAGCPRIRHYHLEMMYDYALKTVVLGENSYLADLLIQEDPPAYFAIQNPKDIALRIDMDGLNRVWEEHLDNGGSSENAKKVMEAIACLLR